MSLDGQRVLIIGAAGGIGQATVKAFTSANAAVTAVGRTLAGSCGATAAKPANQPGYAAIVLANSSFRSFAIAFPDCASSSCTPGIVIDRTRMSTPHSFMICSLACQSTRPSLTKATWSRNFK